MLLARLRRPAGRDVAAGAEPTRRGLGARLLGWFRRTGLQEADWDELEEILLQADLGPALTVELVRSLRTTAHGPALVSAAALREELARRLVEALGTGDRAFAEGAAPQVILMVGVNGVGKTTTIAKLANLLGTNGYTVLLAAGDTFRAGAIDQLKIWGERLQVPVVAHEPGSDAAAVLYDALEAAKARRIDYVIADSAGRQHTNLNLMNELAKMRRVAERQVPGAPHEVLLVLDALTGQNGLQQARGFVSAVQVSGIVIAKLDSSAKGGVAFAVTRELGVPIKFVGTGETVADLAVFDPARFVAALLESPNSAVEGGQA
ncbi:MAG: signal recognition particle-docking protein FtsY [Actinobacteria bacterium]|nr:signal recognition particle-docking protein FtsY [Actinomycetota bacterium]